MKTTVRLDNGQVLELFNNEISGPSTPEGYPTTWLAPTQFYLDGKEITRDEALDVIDSAQRRVGSGSNQ